MIAYRSVLPAFLLTAQGTWHCGALAFLDSVVAQEQVNGVLSESVVEIVFVVASQRVHAVLEQSLLGPLAGSRKIGLQSASARVLDGNQVSVVRPHVLEELDHSAADVIQRLSAVEDSQLREKVLKRALGKHALHHVRAIQTVDAVGSEHSVLGRDQGARAEMENSELVLLVSQPVDENVEPIPSHLLALGVEVERLVALVGTSRPAHDLSERLLHLVFCAAVVDQVDQNQLAVVHD